MAKYKIVIEDDMTLFGMKELMKFIVQILNKQIKLEIDDTVVSIPDSVKKYLNKI